MEELFVAKFESMERQVASCNKCGTILLSSTFCYKDHIKCKCGRWCEITINEKGVTIVEVKKAREPLLVTVPTKVVAFQKSS